MNSLHSVSLAGNTMTIQVTSTSTPEVVFKENVVSVIPISLPNKLGVSPDIMPGGTNYGVRVLEKSSSDGAVLGGAIIPCNVTNQPTWVNTPAGQAQAQIDIRAWLDA